MRSLIISATSLLLILCIWFGFMTYCENTLSLLEAELTQNIQVSVMQEDWDTAKNQFGSFSKDWHKHKMIYSFFLEQSSMLDTDFAIARAQAYIEVRDLPSSLGELAYIREQLKFLFLNERFSLVNIL